MTAAFLLSVPISRPDVVDWLQTVPSDRLSPVVENTLAAGNLALSLLTVSTGEESMQRFFRPVLEPMHNLQGTIEGILKATQKSQKVGELGEQIVAEQLKTCFPADDFQIVSALDHQADIHAGFAINNEDVRKALVEVKFHSEDVAGKEVEKFRRDLGSTGFRYGLLVSLTSRIAGTGPLSQTTLAFKGAGRRHGCAIWRNSPIPSANFSAMRS